MSSLFPNAFFASPSGASNNNTSFHPLFRLLDDFEQHSRNNPSSSENNHTHHPHRQLRTNMKSFTPKFDVKELPEAYELHGDLPGIEQKDIEIEFTDIQTITVRGHTERTYTAGTPPSGFIEGAETPKAIEGSAEKSTENNNNKPAAHKATVEDETAESANSSTSTEVTTTSKDNNATNSKEESHNTEPKAKYWVSERSIGEFSRSFSFPVRVDQDKVSASMKNGVLSIVVPKAKKHEVKKIPIWSQ